MFHAGLQFSTGRFVCAAKIGRPAFPGGSITRFLGSFYLAGSTSRYPLNSFYSPSQTTCTRPSTTLMAVSSLRHQSTYLLVSGAGLKTPKQTLTTFKGNYVRVGSPVGAAPSVPAGPLHQPDRGYTGLRPLFSDAGIPHCQSCTPPLDPTPCGTTPWGAIPSFLALLVRFRGETVAAHKYVAAQKP
jgi:hypothetical protein